MQIEEANLSPVHARIKSNGYKTFQVTDLGSLDGTWV
jgi:hypothetical protein